ncbi:MAG TPA: hypothetical protein VIJ14_11140, partial [Rhabdochlamydiaceae bacterium]
YNLNQSRDFLERSLAIKSCDIMHYQHALTRCFIALLLEEQQLEEKAVEAGRLYKISEEHLTKAEESLEAIPEKTGEALALLGILKYKRAFDHEKIKCGVGCQAVQILYEADSVLKVADPLIKVAIADASRQVAWADFMRGHYEWSSEVKAPATDEGKRLFDSCLVVFKIQNALWQLMEVHKHLSELQSTSDTPLDLGMIDLDNIDLKSIQDQAGHRRESLNFLRRQTHADRLNNGIKNIRLLERFTESTFRDVVILEALHGFDHIDADLFEQLKKHFEEDQKVTEILKKMNLKSVRDNAIETLKLSLAQLNCLITESEDDSQFKPLWDSIRGALSRLEKNYLSLTIFPDNPSEQRTYVQLAEKIGNKFDNCYTLPLFKELLMERLKDFNFVLDLELDMV